MSTPEILIGGASVRAAAESAVRAGLSVVAADLFADTDTRAIAKCIRIGDYPHELLRIRETYSDLPVLYTGAIENYPAIIEKLARSGPFWGTSAASVRALRDPFRLQAVFRKNQIPFPETAMARPGQTFGWLRKSLYSAGGFQVQRLHLPTTKSKKGTYYQRYVNGRPCSASYVALDGKAQLLGIADMLVGCEWLGATDFTYCGSVSRRCSLAETRQWQRVGDVVAEQFAVRGVFGIDAIITSCDREDSVVPIEINPRYTASMEVVELSTGTSALHHHARAFGATLPVQRSTPVALAAKAILYASRPVIFPEGLTSANPRITLADLPAAGERIDKGHPVLSMVARLKDDDAPLSQLKLAAEHIRREIE